MDQEFERYCRLQLIDSYFNIFLAITRLVDRHGLPFNTTMEEMVIGLQCNREKIRRSIRQLKKFGFLRFTAYPAVGYTFFWVRRSGSEVAVDSRTIRRRYAIQVTNGEVNRWIEFGRLATFCREQRITRSNFQKMINGQRNHCGGWRIVSTRKGARQPC
jgi:hypothetical protein